MRMTKFQRGVNLAMHRKDSKATSQSARSIELIPTTVVSWYRQVSIDNSDFQWIDFFSKGFSTGQ